MSHFTSLLFANLLGAGFANITRQPCLWTKQYNFHFSFGRIVQFPPGGNTFALFHQHGPSDVGYKTIQRCTLIIKKQAQDQVLQWGKIGKGEKNQPAKSAKREFFPQTSLVPGNKNLKSSAIHILFRKCILYYINKLVS